MAAPVAAAPPTARPAKLDDLMLAMDVVDTLRHREIIVSRELNEGAREEQLIERLRALYKSQGIEVPDSVLAQGVKALKESRFVYTPPAASLGRSLALLWVRRGRIGLFAALGLGGLVALGVGYQAAVVWPQQRAAEVARLELSETLPRQLLAAHQAVVAEAQVEAARTLADTLLARGRAELARAEATGARQAIGELDALAERLRQEYTLRIAGRPEDQTGFWREVGFGRGRTYYVVVDAVDPRGGPVRLALRNAETNQTETVSRFAVAVPLATFDAVRSDKARNGLVQNARLGEKRRGFLEPEFRMAVAEGRLTRW